MNIGTLLEFPEGYGDIPKSANLYLLDNFRSPNWTYLVEFWGPEKKEKHALIRRIAREDFEAGLLADVIRKSEHQPSLPPWLKDVEGCDLLWIEGVRASAKRSNIELAQDRLCAIQPLIDRVDEIFACTDPAAKISMLAREFSPHANPGRIRVWLCCYLVFGRNFGALYPSFPRIGRWDRKTTECEALGRPPRQGKLTYCHIDKVKKREIEEEYVKHAAIGRSWKNVYVRMIKNVYNCKTVGKEPDLHIVSADGKPFPSINQVRYCVEKAYRPELIGETIYGAQRYRHRIAPDVGRYSEGVSNILELAEADGYYPKKTFRALDGAVSQQTLCVVRLVDVGSGAICGVGFALGSETAAAYRMALFCAAIKKSVFCRLFGLEIDDAKWSCEGVPAKLRLDRGAGAAEHLQGDCMLVPWRELAASYSPQDKATVESSHPRTVRTEGKPQVFESALTTVQAVKLEILQAIADNWGSDASSRLTPAMISEGVAPNPMSIWSWLDRRGRTSGESIDFSTAVRTFLSPVKFKATRDSVSLHVRHFLLAEESRADFHGQLPRGQTVLIDGYAMNLCVRHAWICVGPRLVAVSARLTLRDDEEQLFSSIEELMIEERKLNDLNNAQQHQSIASSLDCRIAAEDATGKDPDSGSWKTPEKGRRGKHRADKAAQRAATTPGGNR